MAQSISSLRKKRRKAFRVAARAQARRIIALARRDRRGARSALEVRRKHIQIAQDSLADIRRIRREKKRRKGQIYPGSSFTWNEAKAKSWYIVLPGYIKSNVSKHARNLDRLRDEINKERRQHGLGPTGINILSWVRSPAKNRAIGGASRSRHLSGDATDISREEVRRLTPWDGGRSFDRIANRVFSNGGFGQYPGGSRHVDSRGYRSRWTSF